jgi:hypothetical protein
MRTNICWQYRDIITDLQSAVDAKIKQKDSGKKSYKKKHNPRVRGGDVSMLHLPRHANLKTPAWAVDKHWLDKLWEADREVEQHYMTDGSADNEDSDCD